MIDLIGKTFGRWLVIKRASSPSSAKAYGRGPFWECVCTCGSNGVVIGQALRDGMSRSCGCLRADVTATLKLTHGKAGTVEHSVWKGMMGRCYTKTNSKYRIYGGRGIKVCERWHSFANFAADMGPRPAGLTIERKNNGGDYEPTNCIWATTREQANNRRDNVLVEFGGERKTIAEWAAEKGLNYMTLWCRVRKAKWSMEKALTSPRLANQYGGHLNGY